jgi:superfamily II DNA/RNA helicase
VSALLSSAAIVNALSFDDSLLPRSGVQIILFSATFPDHVRNFANKFAPSANKIELQREELSVEGIRQFYMDCKNEEHKYDILVSLYQLLTIGQSIIFCQVSRMWPVACSYSFNSIHPSTAIQQTESQNACLLKVTK